MAGVLVLTLAGVLWCAGARAACPDAARIAALARAWEQKAPVRGWPAEMAIEDGLCARELFVRELARTQGRIVGYKAGLTNRAVQQRFGHASPVRGVLFEKMLLPDGAEVPARFGARPVFEADLLVEVKDGAIHNARTHLEALASIARVIPFIELPDLMIAEGEPVNGALIAAINVGARLGVVGRGIDVAPTAEFADALARMRVVVADHSGKDLARGEGAAILGHPLNAAIWLAQDLALADVRLKAGDLLSLGAFTPPLPPTPGTTITVRYEGLPGDPVVSVRFR
ncbi:MAG: fumarylacetoacetate hydrolase [Betaproteobacteria bacterium]|nr:fumarylacetoacetate hydrolase [Betaproteobacteria bacterium]